MFSDVCKIYRREEKYLVLNPLVPSWIVTNINGVLLLKLYSEDKTFIDIATEYGKYAPNIPSVKIIKFLEKAEAERLFEPPVAYFYKPRELKEIFLNITDNCNLKCKFCIVAQRIEDKKYMTLDDYKRMLDEAAEINPKMDIIITGGEALTSPLTVPVAKYVHKIGLNCNTLMTNGTLINESNVDELVSLFNKFSVSLDGSCAEVHDYYRGKGNYDKAVRGIDLLISRGADVAIAMVVTKKNMHDVAKATEKWGDRFYVQPLFPFGNDKVYEELRLTGRDYYETLSKIPRFVPYVGLLPTVKKRCESKILPKCGMADGMLSISRSGNVYPCNNLHNQKYKLGSIFEQSLSEIYNSPVTDKIKYHTVNEVDSCRKCDLKLICGGSCQAHNFCENGDLDIGNNFCEYDKISIINAIFNSAQFQDL